MKRLIAIGAVLLAAVALVVFATGSGDDQGGYRVRAIFDNAAFVIPGMDVRIAGVVVGDIQSIDLTDDRKAAVVLDIRDKGYQDFRTDAFCTIRPQSLIGERYVECSPSDPRPQGSPEPPALPQVKSGPGKGEYLLPASRTARSVDLDLINNIMRLPYRQRFTIFLNEFGAAFGGNGENLQTALKKSSPALRQLENVLLILSRQNRQLAALATNGDRVLQPLARERARVAGFINASNTTAEATAERSAAMEQNLQKFPAFLRELGPTMKQLGAFSEAFTPVVTSLNGAAKDLNTFVTGTPEFAAAGTQALVSLGDTADVGGPALQASLPLVQDLGTLTKQSTPLSQNLSVLLRSLKANGGINRFLDFVFYGSGAINGYDEYGHYLRARLVLTTCQTYATTANASLSCAANFKKDLGATTSPPPVAPPVRTASTATRAASTAAPIAPPKTLLPGDGTIRSGSSAGAAPASSTTSATDRRSAQSLLDYLLGE